MYFKTASATKSKPYKFRLETRPKRNVTTVIVDFKL